MPLVKQTSSNAAETTRCDRRIRLLVLKKLVVGTTTATAASGVVVIAVCCERLRRVARTRERQAGRYGVEAILQIGARRLFLASYCTAPIAGRLFASRVRAGECNERFGNERQRDDPS